MMPHLGSEEETTTIVGRQEMVTGDRWNGEHDGVRREAGEKNGVTCLFVGRKDTRSTSVLRDSNIDEFESIKEKMGMTRSW